MVTASEILYDPRIHHVGCQGVRRECKSGIISLCPGREVGVVLMFIAQMHLLADIPRIHIPV